MSYIRKKMGKKGFTIVELVIVIAVIAILAAVLIPTFSNIIRTAQMNADVQLARNLNTVLANAAAEGRIPSSMYDVLYLINEAGYVLENLNPTTDGFYFAWEQENNRILYIQDDLETVRYPEDCEFLKSDCWVTVATAEEAQMVALHGYNLYLEKDIEEEIVLSNVVSIDTGMFTASSVKIESTATESTTAWLIGNFGTTSINAEGATISTRGVINSLSISGNSASVNIGGSVSSFSAGSGVSTTVNSTGLVSNVVAGNVVNNGVVVSASGGNVTGTAVGSTEGNVVSASTKEDLESIRTQLASGARNFKGETITLTNDVNMNGIAFIPMANFSRDNRNDTAVNSSWFQGVFDGNGYTIQNFSNSGFSITGLNAGTNSSSVHFGNSDTVYNEAVYGLFGTVYNATIKNLKVTCNVDMTIDNAGKYVGDSVGGIVGFAYGTTVTFENCIVSGSVKGYDGVGGLVGRCYATNLIFKNCVNNADVTGVRKTGGFCGSSSGCTVTYENCVNNGTITCLGVEKDRDLGAKGIADTASNGINYYIACAGTVAAKGGATDSATGFTNNGKVVVAGTAFKKDGGNYWINK